MRELERRVSSGRAFGSRVEMITPQKAKELMPLVDESVIQGALWDPDAGLVIPRSQLGAGEMIRVAGATGKLEGLAHTPCTGPAPRHGGTKGGHPQPGTSNPPHVAVLAPP